MKSSIKVDFTGVSEVSAFRPVIRVRAEDSDDPRDGLISSFFQSLGADSSWLSVTHDHHIINGQESNISYYTISPVTPRELNETISIIKNRIKEPFPATESNWKVIDIRRNGNSDKDGTSMHYDLVITKSLKDIKVGVLERAIESVINNPDNFLPNA